jgi:ribose/xylose/arabinose/galactoside ABC-type transport system permease subunit
MLSTLRTSADSLTDGNRTQLLLSVLDNLIWPILVVSFIAFSVLLPELFTTFSNVKFLLYQSAGLGAIALAESICLISGNFDLSVGSIAGFSAMATALLLTKWLPALPGFVGYPFILFVGALLGLINGLCIAKFGVNPFLQTLSTLIIFEGGILVLSTQSVFGLPSGYTWLGGASVDPPVTPEIPIAVFFMFGLFVLLWFVLTKTRFGRAVYAVGGDEESASEAGIDTEFVIIAVYVISGVLAATGGLLLTGFNASVTPSMGTQELFPAFTAAVIGGVSLYGGRGNVFNALGGVLLLTTIQAGLVMLAVGPEFIRTVNGLVLFAAILLYTGVEQVRDRLLSGL